MKVILKVFGILIKNTFIGMLEMVDCFEVASDRCCL